MSDDIMIGAPTVAQGLAAPPPHRTLTLDGA